MARMNEVEILMLMLNCATDYTPFSSVQALYLCFMQYNTTVFVTALLLKFRSAQNNCK